MNLITKCNKISYSFKLLYIKIAIIPINNIIITIIMFNSLND